MPITAIGEILIDLTQTSVDGTSYMAPYPGGAPANVAVAAAKLGVQTAFIGKVGEDGFGKLLRTTLEKQGVDVSCLSSDKQVPTTLAVVTVDEQGERGFSFYRKPGADIMLAVKDVDEELLFSSKIVHFGSVSLTDEPSRSTVLHSVRLAREHGAMISYDPNYRASLWTDETEAVSWMKQGLAVSDIVKVSEEELQLLTGRKNVGEGCQYLMQTYGLQMVFATLGKDGVYYQCGDKTGSLPGRIVKVADTNGAGDTFMAAILTQLVQEETLELSTQRLAQIVGFANDAAALTCMGSGAIPAMPTREQVIQAEAVWNREKNG